jgi:putative DNA primase/helicase
VCGRQALVDYLQTFVGLCLTGVTIDHMLAILYGTGANGKTTLLEVIAMLLGSLRRRRRSRDLHRGARQQGAVD